MPIHPSWILLLLTVNKICFISKAKALCAFFSSSASCTHFVHVCHCHEGIDRCEWWLDLTAYSCLQLYVLRVWYCIFDERKVQKREKLKFQLYSISTVFPGRHWNCILFGSFLVWFNNELLFFDDKTWHFWIFTL